MLNRIVIAVVAMSLLVLGTQARAGKVTPAGHRFHVNTVTDYSQGHSSVAPLKNGGFVVVWTSMDTKGGVRGQMYNASGGRVGGEFKISSSYGESPSVAAFEDGGFVVAYVLKAENGIFARRYNAKGKRQGEEIRISNPSKKMAFENPSVAVMDDGGFVVVWNTDGWNAIGASIADIYGRRLSAANMPVGSQLLIVDVSFDPSPPKVAGLRNGGFVVSWLSTSGGEAGSIFGQRYNAKTTRDGSAFRIDPPLNPAVDLSRLQYAFPSIAGLKDGGFVVIWEVWHPNLAVAGIHGRIYDAKGAPSRKFRANTSQSLPEPYGGAYGGSHSAVAPLADGGFVTVWPVEKDRTIHGQAFDADGRNGREFAADKAVSSNGQYAPAVAGLPNGGFVATWTDSEGKDGGGIFGQRFTK
jgi:hypothetical protein